MRCAIVGLDSTVEYVWLASGKRAFCRKKNGRQQNASCHLDVLLASFQSHQQVLNMALPSGPAIDLYRCIVERCSCPLVDILGLEHENRVVQNQLMTLEDFFAFA
jgi:hypothetical protein